MATATKDQLLKFLGMIKPDDIAGSKTDPKIKRVANKFIKDKPYDEYEEFLWNDGVKYEIHDFLLALTHNMV